MWRGRWARGPALLVLISIVAGCGGVQPSATATVTPSDRPTASPDVLEGKFDVGGYSLWIHCEGFGSPTVVLEAGLGGDSTVWRDVAPDLVADSRVCSYDRAGIGRSGRRLGSPPTSAGAMVDELAGLLDAAGERGPYLLVGHSYGGMIARLFAARHLAEVKGIVFVDAASEHQFEPDWDFNPTEWRDGTWTVDRETSAVELAAVASLGSLPLIVLTQGQMSGTFESLWADFQDKLATLSTDALHMVARDAGHFIQDDAPALVIEAVEALIETARSGAPLPGCNGRFEAVGAECLETTMTDQYAGWELLRAAVVPLAGDLPSGVYRSEITGAQSEAVTGKPEDFNVAVFTWTISGGRWSVTFSHDAATPEVTGDVYAAIADEVAIRFPPEHKIPRTPGVNRFKWAVDADGTLSLQQIDGEQPDPWFTVPWIRVGDAPSD